MGLAWREKRACGVFVFLASTMQESSRLPHFTAWGTEARRS